ncbi:MAG: hypothetical protein JWM21_1904 [Acidobacteria bacterium]|nr:hypothetical protein [Acidobacteriota bacterium]
MKEDILDRVRIATPCSVSWESMNGNEQARYCSQCKLQVYDISKLTRREAVSLLTSSEGRVCGRLYRRPDGTLLTRDCPVGLRALRRRAARIAGATLAAVLGLLSPIAAQKHKADKDSCKDIPAARIETKVIAGQEGIVKGVVMDPVGAVVPGAKLTLINELTETKLTAEANDKGEFIFSGVGKGKYSLEVESPGFKRLRLTELLHGESEELLLTATLHVAGEQVTVGILVSSEPISSLPGTMIITSDMIQRLPH